MDKNTLTGFVLIAAVLISSVVSVAERKMKWKLNADGTLSLQVAQQKHRWHRSQKRLK